MKKGFFTISELAKEFDVTPRTIRFYEEQGLLNPKRTNSNQRHFCNLDRVRLKLILRGRSLGLNLKEISAILGNSFSRFSEEEQLKKALDFGVKYLERIREQIRELQNLENELLRYGSKCVRRLNDLGHKKEISSNKYIQEFL